jgi:hypothetical protein
MTKPSARQPPACSSSFTLTVTSERKTSDGRSTSRSRCVGASRSSSSGWAGSSTGRPGLPIRRRRTARRNGKSPPRNS